MTDSRRVDLPAVVARAVPPVVDLPGAGPAPDYLRVARPHADVAGLALAALLRTGIAARTSPVDPRLPGGAAAGARVEPRVELWVDARELDDALTVLAAVARHGGVSDSDLGRVGEETALSDLGAVPADGSERPGTATPEADDTPPPTRNPTPSARPYPTPARPRPASSPLSPPSPPPARDARGVEDVDDEPAEDLDEHFRPDEPESLRTLSRTTVWALVILTVGVVALALSGLFPRLVGVYAPLTSLLGTAAVLVGVGMLVTRLRDGRPDDDDRGGPNGDGAVL